MYFRKKNLVVSFSILHLKLKNNKKFGEILNSEKFLFLGKFPHLN